MGRIATGFDYRLLTCHLTCAPRREHRAGQAMASYDHSSRLRLFALAPWRLQPSARSPGLRRCPRCILTVTMASLLPNSDGRLELPRRVRHARRREGGDEGHEAGGCGTATHKRSRDRRQRQRRRGSLSLPRRGRRAVRRVCSDLECATRACLAFVLVLCSASVCLASMATGWLDVRVR